MAFPVKRVSVGYRYHLVKKGETVGHGQDNLYWLENEIIACLDAGDTDKEVYDSLRNKRCSLDTALNPHPKWV